MKVWKNDIINKDELVLINHDESLSCVLHSHNFYEIEYVYKGSVTQIINGVTYAGKKGDIFFMTPNDKHAFEKSQNYDSFNFLIHPDLVVRFQSKYLESDCNSIKKKIHLSSLEMNRFENILHNIESELLLKDVGYIDIIQNYALITLTLLHRYSADSSEISKSESNFNLILQFIEENYSTVTPKKIATSFFYNQNYLCKIFKEKTRLTMTAYINQIKINHAIQLLKTSTESIESICRRVGIPDKKYFYKLFKIRTGLTPKEFRLPPSDT